MPSPSKNKGSAWEREVARDLTELYKESFIRAPGSGAYVGGTNSGRKQYLHEGQIRSFKGDIVPGESFPLFNAECKSYKEFPFHRLLLGEPIPLFEDWIGQTLDAADEEDFNIIIMKFNYVGKFIATEHRHNLGTTNFVEYHSKNTNTTWRITGYNHFWQENSEKVRTLCAPTK